MSDWLAARWWLFFLGGLAGLYSGLDWLTQHQWEGILSRLALTGLAGALVFWLLGELAFLAGRGRGLAARAAGPGRVAASVILAPILPLARPGKAFWRTALLALLLALAGIGWWQAREPSRGESEIRRVFLNAKGVPGQGLACLLAGNPAGAGPWRQLPLQKAFDFSLAKGFPGGARENFSLRFLGLLKAEKTGWYGLGGVADDGLSVRVDGREVARDLAAGPARRVWGRVRLEAGWHALDIRYLQLSGGAVLQLLWQPPGQKPAPLPAQALAPLRPPFPLARVERLRLRHGLAPGPGSTYPPLQGGRFWKLPW